MDALCIIIENNRWVIASALIMAAIGAYLVAVNNRRNRFAIASEKFRSTILNELEGLYPTPSKWPFENKFQIKRILEDKCPKIEVAVTEFRCHLSWFNRRRFDTAWQKYHKDDYYEYMPLKETGYERGKIVVSIDTTETYLDNFKHNVDNLLRFAKQK